MLKLKLQYFGHLMRAGSYSPAHPGVFLWPSVNKIQLFSALQMQPPAVQ